MESTPLAGRLRDSGVYSSRNTSKGALIAESGRVIAALAGGMTVDEVRRGCLDGRILRQRTRASRFRVWQVIHYRLLAPGIEWILDDLKDAATEGTQSSRFVSLLYLHYALRDRLSFDFVTNVIARRWADAAAVTREDIIGLLDESASPARRWSDESRRKLAGSILTALRDFGLLKGVQKKRIVRPVLPLATAEHLLRILILEGVQGAEVLRDPTWRLFLLSPDDVAHVLSQLAQDRRISFERVGSTVVLAPPESWRSSR